MPLRTVALIAAISITVGWLLAATLSPPVARLQTRPERQARPPAASETAPFTEQLNLRLRAAPLPPGGGRNPFTFAERERVVASPDDEVVPTRAPRRPEPAPVRTLRYTLSGIGISGDVRTAIITDGQDVRIVKLDEVIGDYAVVEITDTSVTLASDTERRVLRLDH